MYGRSLVNCPENAAAGLRKKGAKELGGAPGVWPGYQPHCHVAAWFVMCLCQGTQRMHSSAGDATRGLPFQECSNVPCL